MKPLAPSTVRVNLANPHLNIKPGMLAEGTLRAELSEEGFIIDPELAPKYISPMHPEIIRDGPGPCPICGMDLVKATDLGYRASSPNKKLVIPHSAPLLTGKRAVVYVEEETEDGFFL